MRLKVNIAMLAEAQAPPAPIDLAQLFEVAPDNSLMLSLGDDHTWQNATDVALADGEPIRYAFATPPDKTFAQHMDAQPELWDNPIPIIYDSDGSAGAYNQSTQTLSNSAVIPKALIFDSAAVPKRPVL